MAADGDLQFERGVKVQPTPPPPPLKGEVPETAHELNFIAFFFFLKIYWKIKRPYFIHLQERHGRTQTGTRSLSGASKKKSV